MKKYSIFAIFTLALLSCTRHVDSSYRETSGETWGTFYHITYRSSVDLSDSITAVMKQIDLSLSPFCKESLVARINAGEDVAVDSMFSTVFRTAREVSRLSSGHFDPTVAPLVNLWGFGYREGTANPSPEQIATALATVGIGECTLADGRVVKKSPTTEFDFSAIAKGYGCDRVAAMLERNGCHDYLVEIGGEMALKGVNNRGEKWVIRIDAPIIGKMPGWGGGAATVQMSDCGVASSGNYRNFRKTESGVIGHTISPITGQPVQTELLAVTVIAPDAMWADALATACMAMPLDEGRLMIQDLPHTEAMFITAAADSTSGVYNITTTPGFPRPLD